jgi:hypothetical protein
MDADVSIMCVYVCMYVCTCVCVCVCVCIHENAAIHVNLYKLYFKQIVKYSLYRIIMRIFSY